GARRAHDRDVFVAADRERYTPEGVDDFAAHVILAANIMEPDYRVAHEPGPRFGGDLSSCCFTRVLSRMSRMAWYGPATMLSPTLSPSRTSKCSSPAMPTLTGTNE